MNIFLGDEITIKREETYITGKVHGLVLDGKGELERLYINGIDQAFWLNDKWLVVDDTEEEEDEL